MRAPLSIALLLLPAALAAQQPAAHAPRAVAGCWSLALGPWTPAIPVSAAHALPSRIALDTVPAEDTGVRGSFRVRALAGAAGTARHVATWSPLPFRQDSLRIRWSTVGAGVDARLRVRAGELRGVATAFGVEARGGATTATAPLVARRVPDCAAAPPPDAAPAAPGVTELGGLEARGTPEARAPSDRPEEGARPRVQPARVPPSPPAPPSRAEQVAGYTVGGVILWLLLNATGVL